LIFISRFFLLKNNDYSWKMNQIWDQMSKSLLRNSFSRICFEQKRDFNANRAVVTRVRRNLFTRLYPTTLVNADGSTVRIKYPTPRILVKLPLDFAKLDTEMQRKIRLLRQPTGVKAKKQEIKVAFDPLKYAKNRK